MTTADESLTQAPLPGPLLGTWRRRARWLLLVGYVLGMSVWALSFAHWCTGVVAVVIGCWAWLLFGAAGLVVLALELVVAHRRRSPWRIAAPSWGTLLWVAAPVLWLLCFTGALDARLWLWWHADQLTAIADEVRRTGQPEAAERLGHRVEVDREADVVLFVHDGFMSRYGLAHDPRGSLRTRQVGDMCLSRATHLRGPWWVFCEDD